jgi:hypothetical protein
LFIIFYLVQKLTASGYWKFWWKKKPCEAHFIPINFLETAVSLVFIVLRRILIHGA